MKKIDLLKKTLQEWAGIISLNSDEIVPDEYLKEQWEYYKALWKELTGKDPLGIYAMDLTKATLTYNKATDADVIKASTIEEVQEAIKAFYFEGDRKMLELSGAK